MNYRQWADADLKTAARERPADSRARLHASLALLSGDPAHAEYVYKRLLEAPPADLPVIWKILREHDREAVRRLWKLLQDSASGAEKRFRAASALASTPLATTEKDWDTVAPFIADHCLAAVIKDPGDYLPLIESLHPLRAWLVPSLIRTFRDPARADLERSFATSIVALYAADDPVRLADALMSADAKQYATLFPAAHKVGAEVLPVLEAEIDKRAMLDWDDAPLDPAWATPDPAWKSQLESARGFLDARFAYCQTITLDEFLSLAEGLRKCGYRPSRVRPYPDGAAIRVAAVWTRDGRSWRMASGMTLAEMEQSDRNNREEKYLPVDVAGYVGAGSDGKPSDRFAVIWIESKQAGDDARMLAGVTATDHQAAQKQLKAARMAPMTIQAARAAEGSTRYCSVWRKAELSEAPAPLLDQSEINLAGSLATNAWSFPTEISVSSAAAPPTTVERRATANLKEADAAIKAKADDLSARFRRAIANLQLGNHQESLNDLDAVLLKAPQTTSAFQHRAIAHARLHHQKEALDDVTAYRKTDVSESSKLYLAVVVVAELGDGQDDAYAKLESALKMNPRDFGLYYDAARGFALTARALKATNPAKSLEQGTRAIALLKEAIRVGYSDFDFIQQDPDLDPIRELPAFAEIMNAGRADCRYAALWSSDVRFESVPVYGLDPATHDAQCRKLISEGFRPVSVSLTKTVPDGPPVTASVWQRPVVTENVKDALAMRQARAAVALVRLGKPEAVWPLLRHSADPRLRSFIINWLNPLGADPGTLTAEFARPQSNPRPAEPGEGGRRPGERSPAQAVASVGRGSPDLAHPTTEGLPSNPMPAILFQPETSIRRALILSLGTYATDKLSPADREPLIARLLDLYENDPDSGIHAAAEWTLRKWGQEAKLNDANNRLAKLDFKGRGPRRWYVNSQAQTFTLIEGPVEFRMGSPASEPDRVVRMETSHRRVILRNFAIATKEVTVEQYLAFAAENPDHEISLDQYSPDRKGPMNGTNWFDAAAYCNWLSRKEGLGECYEPNIQKKYAEGMTIRADALRRSGYRLPTEAEWEYSCRAGAETPRYHGASLDLLPAYAWYQKSSTNRTSPGGSLFPNDLGLFDSLGNTSEWCQDAPLLYKPDRTGTQYDDINISESVTRDRRLRGGAFVDLPSDVRAAVRSLDLPSSNYANVGFRPARTYN